MGKIKRGVSLYSYQQAYYLRQMDLEACIKAAAELSTDGIEIIADAMIEGYPYPDERFFDSWHNFMSKYKTRPVCCDVFLDGWKLRDRAMTDEEACDILIRDIKIANKMGFKNIRCLSRVPLEIIIMALPYAEEYDVRLGKEVHAPELLDGKLVTELVEYAAKTGSKYIGLIPDMGIFQYRLPRVTEQWRIRRGCTPAIVKVIGEAYRTGQAREVTEAAVMKMNPNKEDLSWLRSCFRTMADPSQLGDLAAYIFNIHGKVLEMTDEFTGPGDYAEYGIDYAAVIPYLKKAGYDGYICTEYEGQRYLQDTDYVDDETEQVRRHHEMLKKLIG